MRYGRPSIAVKVADGLRYGSTRTVPWNSLGCPGVLMMTPGRVSIAGGGAAHAASGPATATAARQARTRAPVSTGTPLGRTSRGPRFPLPSPGGGAEARRELGGAGADGA